MAGRVRTRRPGAARLARAHRHPALNQAAAAREAVTGARALGPYVAYRAASLVARRFPLAVTELAARRGGPLLARVLPGRAAMLERHLRRVQGPALSGRELEAAVQRALSSYARYWLESFRLPGTPPCELAAAMTWEGLEHVDEALAGGKGVILALPHLGGWDFGGAWLGSLGYRVVAVVEPVEPPVLFEWFARLRRSLGIEVVALGPGVASTVLRRLRQGAVVALVCDRDIGGTGVEVEFFGERTRLPAGPAAMALRTGAALLPSAVYFRGRRGHHAVMGPPLRVERQAALRVDVARVTQLLAHELESLVRRAPEQWHLLQPNWPSDR